MQTQVEMNCVEVGKTAGFCGGVSLCIKRLNEEIESNDVVYCLGEVVHNKDVVSNFEEKGVIFVDSLDDIPVHGTFTVTFGLISDSLR